ncbi:LCCL domain-containing protein [Spirosoma endbachense]|nr:LCCL domain-containing protein [Spirosoma endbachense]
MNLSSFNYLAALFYWVYLCPTGQAQSPGLRFNQAWLATSQSNCMARARQGLANGQCQLTGQGSWWLSSINLTTRTVVCVSCIPAGSQTQAYVSAAGTSDPASAQWVDYLLKYIVNPSTPFPAMSGVGGQVPTTTLRFNQAWLATSQSDCLAKAKQGVANGQFQITGQGDWWMASSNQTARTAVCVSCITVGAQTQAYVTAASVSDPLATQWVEYLLKYMASGQGSTTTTTTTTGTAIDWNTRANFQGAEIGKRVTYSCPAGGTAQSVWGTDIYTHDSSICTAAVHSGLITIQYGGGVTIEFIAGQSAYTGSTRNGITTNGYQNWGLSFRFVR